MTRLPLSTLPAFQAAARHANLRAAADALHLTHSAVSQQIRVLEEQLGFAALRAAWPPHRAQRRGRGAAGAASTARCASSTTASHPRRLRRAAPRSGCASPCCRRSRSAGSCRASAAGASAIPTSRSSSTPRSNVVDLQRDGFHAALRTGARSWPGLASDRLDRLAARRRRLAGRSPAPARPRPEALARRAAARRRRALEAAGSPPRASMPRCARSPTSTTPASCCRPPSRASASRWPARCSPPTPMRRRPARAPVAGVDRDPRARARYSPRLSAGAARLAAARRVSRLAAGRAGACAARDEGPARAHRRRAAGQTPRRGPQGSQSQATAPGAAPALTRRARPKAPVAGRRVCGARTTQRAQRKPCTARAARDA